MTMEKIKVVADFDWLENEETIGLLGHESQRGTDVYTFEYDKDWLKRHHSLMHCLTDGDEDLLI